MVCCTLAITVAGCVVAICEGHTTLMETALVSSMVSIYSCLAVACVSSGS